jgi:transposase
MQSDVKAKSRSNKAPIQAERAFGVRSVKDLMEEALFAKRRNLFTKLQLFFFDAAGIYFEGNGGDELGRRGHSKDHRPDLNQVVVGVVMDQMGFPVCTEVWPGNTADVTTLLPISERLKKRFNISNVCIVADRGMISKNTIEALKDMNWNYILGAKMRRAPDMKEVFADDSPFIEVVSPRTKLNDPAPLKVKEVIVGDNRYIVCLNDEEAAKDRHTRDEIIKKLEEAIKNGDKSLVGNKGFRRYIVSKKNYAVNYQKIEEEKQYDGIFILRTDLKLPSQEIALQYKQLLGVETIFRTTKSIFETRPIFHQNDETIRGHIWCSYLAILLRKTLMDALEQNKKPEEPKLEWNDVVADLKMLTTTEAEVNGKRIRLRPSAKPGAARAFRALGLGLPKLVELLGKVETV